MVEATTGLTGMIKEVTAALDQIKELVSTNKISEEEATSMRALVFQRHEVRHAQHDMEVLAKHLSAADRRRLQPWRVAEERCQVQRDAILAQTPAAVRDAFVTRSKDHDVSPEDVLTAMYVFWGNEDALRFFRGLLARTQPGFARIQAHNFYVASLSDASFLESHGGSIEKLQWPLFPPDPSFATLNQRLLNEAGDPAGGDPHSRPSVYRQVQPEGGEYWAAVQQTARGPAVDLSEVEAAVLNLQSTSVSTEAKLAHISRGLEQLHRARDSIRGLPPRSAPNYRSRGRGGGRGRGAVTGDQPRGGETTSQAPPPPRNF